MVLLAYYSLLHNCIYLGHSLIPAKNLIHAKKLALLNYNIILHYMYFQRCMVFKKHFWFFFSPTSLDAMVFGYIAPLIKGPLISCQLVKHINGFSNLCNHTNRILSRFFPPTPEGQSIHVFEAGNVIIFHNEIVNYAENKNVSGQCFIYFCNIQIWKDSVRKRKKRMKQ